MIRLPFLISLAALSILCRAAPMHSGGRRDVSSSGTPSSSANAPLPSADYPTSISVNWEMYGESTRGYAINHLLATIDPNAWQRWVTAEISSTQIGGSDAAGSNKDLSAAVETVLTSNSTYQRSRWIDLYTQFLIEAGGNVPANVTYQNEYMNATKAYATEEVKLVQAYTAAHPTNISSVGVDVFNITHIDPLTIGWMQYWASYGGDANCTSSPGNPISRRNSTLNGTSSSDSSSGAIGNCTLDSEGAYTTEDYQRYLAAASQMGNLAPNATKMTNQSLIANAGYSLRNPAAFTFPRMNFSMDIGGSGSLTQYAPVWTATIIGWSMRNNSGLQTVDSNLGAKRTPRDRLETRQSSGGFSALQVVAHSMSYAGGKSDHSGFAPDIATAAVAPSSEADTVFSVPLAPNEGLILLSVKEGSWADDRDNYIRSAQMYTPDIVEQYFGGKYGTGPIGRHWTHLVLGVTINSKNGSVEVSTTDLYGSVYEVLPVLSELSS
ncbi:hypothetical protein C8F04DRAFT_410463 [Mycena alexandri]|uniref:Uncharacterized protein n=1 Tax=Mycena alexandri TaxID=1745969 RepID=A0AAD6X3A8_9AGAR|nr:hypothetical protein C8F04DRAFT_410463 [Mycena alexandri]